MALREASFWSLWMRCVAFFWPCIFFRSFAAVLLTMLEEKLACIAAFLECVLVDGDDDGVHRGPSGSRSLVDRLCYVT